MVVASPAQIPLRVIGDNSTAEATRLVLREAGLAVVRGDERENGWIVQSGDRLPDSPSRPRTLAVHPSVDPATRDLWMASGVHAVFEDGPGIGEAIRDHLSVWPARHSSLPLETPLEARSRTSTCQLRATAVEARGLLLDSGHGLPEGELLCVQVPTPTGTMALWGRIATRADGAPGLRFVSLLRAEQSALAAAFPEQLAPWPRAPTSETARAAIVAAGGAATIPEAIDAMALMAFLAGLTSRERAALADEAGDEAIPLDLRHELFSLRLRLFCAVSDDQGDRTVDAGALTGLEGEAEALRVRLQAVAQPLVHSGDSRLDRVNAHLQQLARALENLRTVATRLRGNGPLRSNEPLQAPVIPAAPAPRKVVRAPEQTRAPKPVFAPVPSAELRAKRRQRVLLGALVLIAALAVTNFGFGRGAGVVEIKDPTRLAGLPKVERAVFENGSAALHMQTGWEPSPENIARLKLVLIQFGASQVEIFDANGQLVASGPTGRPTAP